MEGYDEKTVKELLEAFGKKTVREVMSTGTSNAAIPTLVSAKTLWYLNTFPDVRAEDFALQQEMPPGTGLTYKFQVLTSPTYQSWGTGGTQQDGTAATPVDLTLAAPTITKLHYGQATRLSDLLQDSTVFSFVEAIGYGHAQAIRKAINTLLWTALKTASDNKVTGGTSGDGARYSPTFANIITAKGYCKSDIFMPNALVTCPVSWDAMLSANWTNAQLSGALIQYVTTGGVQRLLGMDVIEDPLFEPASPTANAAGYMACFVRSLALGWAYQGGIETEIQRQALAIAQDIVTHITGGAGLLIDKAVAQIVHAGT